MSDGDNVLPRVRAAEWRAGFEALGETARRQSEETEQLRARVEALEAALREIVRADENTGYFVHDHYQAIGIAERALGENEHG